MNQLDERLRSAASDLDRQLNGSDLPPFRPKRSATPAMFVLVLLVGIGIFGFVARSQTNDGGGISVATQPVVPETVSALDRDLEPAGQSIPEAAPTPKSTEATGQTFTRTNAADGEFFVPLPGASSWSVDESWVLLYRTGTGGPSHVVIDATEPAAPPVELSISPPDIEQVYWHPFESDVLLYASGADLVTFDVVTGQVDAVHSFTGCDRVDSGASPVPPSADGTVSLLCHGNGDLTQITYDLVSGEERRAPTQSDGAAAPSPSGELLVQWNADGSASVLDRDLNDTGVVLDLGNNLFEFVTDPQGVEWIATTLFDGPLVGSVVLMGLDTQHAPIVLIGPSRGDGYPPAGTMLSARAGKVAVSIRGAEDESLAGRVTIVDLDESFENPPRTSFVHNSEDLHGYWSTPFVSLSPSGRTVIYSSDDGTHAVNTYAIALSDIVEVTN